MKVMFRTNTLNYRGTTVAITDYAKYNQEILGNESVIAYCEAFGNEKDFGNESEVLRSLEKNFQVINYTPELLNNSVDEHKIDFCYTINYFSEKEILPTNCKTGVHAVFQFNEPHGDRYAYVSKWLSEVMTQGRIPFVPHIIHLPSPNMDFRDHLGISREKIVIGRIGGYYSFDLPFVKDFIIKFAESHPQYEFVFVGTHEFTDQPNVKFLKEIYDPVQKANFISSCDAMIHARWLGESFGLALSEFLYFNKPVISWNGGQDQNHLDILKNSETLYNNEYDLERIFLNIKDIAKKEVWYNRVQMYNPASVMEQFKKVFYN